MVLDAAPRGVIEATNIMTARGETVRAIWFMSTP
jgi:hypothetical protein